MDEEEDPSEFEHELDPIYLSYYLETLHQVKTHLSGQDDFGAGSLSPSFIPPTGFWTSQEKDVFFHALSIHSRLRPDLIADCIKTKTTVDVCNYMELLEDAAGNEELVRRKTIPGAMEVSEKWIEFEEQKAAGIVRSEEVWNEARLEEKREEELSARRKLLKAGKTQGVFKPWATGQRERWKKEDFCKALGRRELVAIDTILRQAEEATAEPGSRETSQSRQSIIPQSLPVPLLTHSPPPAPAAIDVSMIDPALLALSSESDPVQLVHDKLEPSFHGFTPSAPSKKGSRSPLPAPSPAPADLSPASRRRHQKRLYMRRKRAEVTGRELDDGVGRLKPGRKQKQLAHLRPVLAETSTETMDVDGRKEQDDDFHHPHVSGRTLPYKILARFTEMDIDAEALANLGLNLFHLSGLSKLMNLYALLHEDGLGLATKISHETIQLLRAHIVHFVTNLVHRVVVVREQELSLKTHTKVWKISDKQVVTKENVDQALEMMGSGGSKQEYFDRLIERFDVDAEEDDEGSVSSLEQDGSASESSSMNGMEDTPARPPMNREIYAPFIRLSTSGDESSLMPDENDDELLTELLEEQELEKMDSILDGMHEKGLWERFLDARTTTNRAEMGRRSDLDGDTTGLYDPSDDAGPSINRITSKAFISDSD